MEGGVGTRKDCVRGGESEISHFDRVQALWDGRAPAVARLHSLTNLYYLSSRLLRRTTFSSEIDVETLNNDSRCSLL